jgi:hypothetical protein
MNITKIKAEKQLAVGVLPITPNADLLSCEPYLWKLDFADDACN